MRPAGERVTERRARLVDATIRVLAGSGEAHATMTAICAEAGLTERYYYESFRSLDDALLAALDSVCDEILGLATRVIEETPGPPDVRVHAVMEAFVGLVVANPEKARVAVIHSSANPRLRARRTELLTVFADFVARILRYANETPNRVPLSDLYFTDTGRKIGFQARSVLGGLFVGLMDAAG